MSATNTTPERPWLLCRILGAGRSVKSVAEAIGVKTSSVYNWANGETEPADGSAAALASELGLDRNELSDQLKAAREAEASRRAQQTEGKP